MDPGSADKPEPVDANELNIPTYWIRPSRTLSTEPGMHRFVWDLHYPPPDSQEHTSIQFPPSIATLRATRLVLACFRVDTP